MKRIVVSLIVIMSIMFVGIAESDSITEWYLYKEYDAELSDDEVRLAWEIFNAEYEYRFFGIGSKYEGDAIDFTTINDLGVAIGKAVADKMYMERFGYPYGE